MDSTDAEVEDRIRDEFPIHWLVWHNEHITLSELLQQPHNMEKIDPRGRTALMLAVTLGHVASARVLLTHGADANSENADGWTVAQEAVAHGDPELVRLVVRRREVQRHRTRASGIPRLLQRLRDAPDFYVEMRWEFASWVPLVSRLCPSDTYRVYKRGANVRVDTTLLGFEQTAGNWQRGSRSYVFRGGNTDGEGCTATLLEVDHDARQVIVEEMLDADIPDDIADYMVDDMVERRLSAPIVATYVDTDKIAFERNKNSGLGGLMGALWKGGNGSERTETVAGHECRVFAATNVQLVTKTRTEHLQHNAAASTAPGPLQSLLSGGTITTQQETHQELVSHESSKVEPLSAVEYFSTQRGDIGARAKRVETRVQRFKATLWLAESYPLSLPEQVLPIVDLMATSSPHFAKLRDFIRLQLPAGFPVKIEIPLFHVLNARITFGNIFGKEEAVEGVSQLVEENEQRLTCVVDDAAFEPPASYSMIGGSGTTAGTRSAAGQVMQLEEQDELLQFAIQQSLLDAAAATSGQPGADSMEEVDIWEALRYDNAKSSTTVSNRQRHMISEEERQLQRAIQASLSLDSAATTDSIVVDTEIELVADNQQQTTIEEDLMKALRLSEEERLRDEERQRQEQRELEEIIKLSLTEK